MNEALSIILTILIFLSLIYMVIYLCRRGLNGLYYAYTGRRLNKEDAKDNKGEQKWVYLIMLLRLFII